MTKKPFISKEWDKPAQYGIIIFAVVAVLVNMLVAIIVILSLFILFMLYKKKYGKKPVKEKELELKSMRRI